MSTRYLINGQTHHDLPEGHHLDTDTPNTDAPDTHKPGLFWDLVRDILPNLALFAVLAAMTLFFMHAAIAARSGGVSTAGFTYMFN